MKTKRYLSDAYVDATLAKIDALFEKHQQNIIVTPECLSDDYYESKRCGYSSVPPHDREKIKEYFQQLRELAYVQGFWRGWCLRDGTKEK